MEGEITGLFVSFTRMMGKFHSIDIGVGVAYCLFMNGSYRYSVPVL